MEKVKSLAKSATIIIIASLIGKFLGFFRELLIASKFGAGYETDTYVLVITATMFLSSLVGAALNSTLIPILISIEEKQGKAAKIKYTNNILNILIIFSLIIIILSWIFSPIIIRIFATGFEGEQFDLAVKLNRIGLPMIAFNIATCVYSGFLQSSQKFLTPAAIGIPLNLVYILYLLFIGEKFGLVGLMLASILAYLSQVLLQIPSTKNLGYKYLSIVDFKDKNIKKILLLSGPVVLGLSAQQINIIVDRTMSSRLIEGSISSLNYAAKTSFIFTDIFIVAITTVIFPVLSKAFNENNMILLKKIIIEGTKLITLITIPASVGMIVLSKPIIQLLFQRGAFDSNATNMTSQAFIYYCIAMTFIGLKRLLLKVYYSLEDSKTPMINGVLEVGINIVLNIVLVQYMAHKGLALATSVAVIITFFILLYSLKQKIGSVGFRDNLDFFLKVLLASALMGGVVYLTFNILYMYLSGSFIINLILLGICVVVGVATYLIICVILRVKEINIIFRSSKQKISEIRIGNKG